MKKSAWGLLFLTFLPAAMQADSQRILRASFPDGAALEIFTQTTGSSPISPLGAMGITTVEGSQNVVFREVVDRANNVLFAYKLEASKGASPGVVKIRIEPLTAEMEKSIGKSAGTRTPTVAATREFPDVAIGQAVALDILYNPSTGEKVYDVLRPIPGSSSVMSVDTLPATETIALNRVALRVNGRTVAAPASLTVGAAIRIDIPHHGTYVIAASEPHETSNHSFAPIAHADGKTLSWTTGGDHFEITSEANVLTQAEKGALWVFHDPRFHPDVVALQSADTVDWLLPKK